MPDPISLLNAWLALEALEPQSFPKQEKLIPDEPPRRRRVKEGQHPARLLVPFDLESGVMPWQTPAGDRQVLGLDATVGIRWYVPLAFVQMKPAIDLLVRKMEADGPEREAGRGVSILALASFDEQGYAAPSNLLLSSFGWAAGEVLAGRIDSLHRYLDIEDDLRQAIGDPLVERGDDGLVIPTTRRGFGRSMSALKDRLKLPQDLLERPRVAIRMIGDVEKDPVDIINSLLLDDLHRVRTSLQSEGRSSKAPALSSYLGLRVPAERCDVLDDKVRLEELLAPRRFPLARWPAPKPAKLVTLQQAAVNAAATDLADGGLMAINGPPGTGKTTLLRDVIAAVIFGRAEVLETFERPEDAFRKVDLVAEGGQNRDLFALDERLRGHGIVVASSNNAAVRNVSAELPLDKAVAKDMDLRYFAGTANVVNDMASGCWGLIAAVLGNRSNRTRFVEAAWWDEEWGLERYFAAVTGRVARGRGGRAPSKAVEEEQPPTTRSLAMERWRRACLEYREKRAEVRRMALERDQVRIALSGGAGERQAIEAAERAAANAARLAEQAAETRRIAAQALAKAEQDLADARLLLSGTIAAKPGLLARVLGRKEKWHLDHEHAQAWMQSARDVRVAAEREHEAAAERCATAEAELNRANTALAIARENLEHLHALAARCPDLCEGLEAGPDFWGRDHQAIHTASPWADAAFTRARDELFASALRLHRAFIDAAASPMKSNLGLIMDHLKGKRIPSGADQHLGDLWDSLFLLIPLVSTTFASFGRLMDGMGPESIGWLIVDEAGQATPQAAIGAIWRARRALIIGDPLQIEPVTMVPPGLVRSICAAHDAHPDLWAAPRASVQTLADAASTLMARMNGANGVREIGLPLLVHRRCQDPMFSIANIIAYDGLMVHAVKDEPSAVAAALSPRLPGSCWINVISEAPKWSPQEGQVVLEMLRALAERGVRRPSLYIISPFRDVADTMRKRIVTSGVLEALGIPKKGTAWQEWGKKHVGTVHTFQGKEAEAVILVLGASAEASRGSRSWAGSTPNILNVAATRAKQVLHIVGHYERWRKAGVFLTAANMLPLQSWTAAGGIPSDDDGITDEEPDDWSDPEELDEGDEAAATT